MKRVAGRKTGGANDALIHRRSGTGPPRENTWRERELAADERRPGRSVGRAREAGAKAVHGAGSARTGDTQCQMTVE
jgi:hypothetical protein